MKILYIEDDFIDQMLFKRLVKRMNNIDYWVVSSLEEAIDITQKYQFDILITDYYLNGDTAFDVLKTFPNTSVLVVSGFEDKEQLNKLKELGAIGCIPKPICRKDLETALYNELETPIEDAITVVVDKKKLIETKNIEFDYTYLNQLTGNSEKVRREMIQIFIDFIPNKLIRLNDFFEESNWIQVSLSIHKIKSNMRLMGLHHLLEISNKIERYARFQTDISYVKLHTPFVINSMRKAIQLAKNLFKKNI